MQPPSSGSNPVNGFELRVVRFGKRPESRRGVNVAELVWRVDLSDSSDATQMAERRCCQRNNTNLRDSLCDNEMQTRDLGFEPSSVDSTNLGSVRKEVFTRGGPPAHSARNAAASCTKTSAVAGSRSVPARLRTRSRNGIHPASSLTWSPAANRHRAPRQPLSSQRRPALRRSHSRRTARVCRIASSERPKRVCGNRWRRDGPRHERVSAVICRERRMKNTKRRRKNGRPDKKILATIIERVVEAARPDRIIVFGSAARRTGAEQRH